MTTHTLGSLVSGPYGFVLFEVVILCLQVVLSAIPIGSRRKKYFTKEFFEKNFPELKGDFPKGGYPDMGSGKYSQKLTTSQWLDFNVAQRQHLNFVEQIVPMIVPLLVAGLFQPKLAVLCGAASIVGRFLYSVGYLTGNPKSRMMGSPFIYISMLTCVVVSLMGSFAAAGGVKGLLALVGDVATLNILA